MSKCKCDLRTKLVGDGCRYCNPQEYIDKLIESLEEQRTWVGLTDEDKLHMEIMGGKSDVMLAEMVEAKLKEKNT
jgi:hypothetical protein